MTGHSAPGRLATRAVIFALAFAIRCISWPAVFFEGQIHFFGSDALYHARRVLYTIARFPELLLRDPYVGFPQVGSPIWPPFFDGALAAIARPLCDASEPACAEALLVWVPPALGAATVVALHALAERHFGRRVALAAAVLLCVLPAHTWYSQLGYLDHHSAVAFLSTLLLGSTLALVAALESERSPVGTEIRHALAVGALSAALLLVWPGGLLHVALVQAGLVLHALSREREEDARRAMRALVVAQSLAFAGLLVPGASAVWPQWGPFSPVVISGFQPWLFGTLTVFALGSAGIWRWPLAGKRAGATRAARAVSALLLLGLVSGTGFALLGLGDGVADAWRWLARTEGFQAQVGESLPLFREGSGLGTQIAELRFSRLIYLFPVAWAALVLRSLRDPQRSVLLVVAGWALALALATLAQRRFFNSFAVVFALVMGWAGVRAVLWAVARLPAGALSRLAAGVALVALLGLLLAPLRGEYAPLVQRALARVRGTPASVLPIVRTQRALRRTGEWLGANSPETSGYYDASSTPEYSVLAAWDRGHALRYFARRPVVVDNFGDDVSPGNFALASRFFSTADPWESADIAARLGVRYVVAEASRTAPRPGAGSVPIGERLHAHDGLGLGGYRLVFESRATTTGVRGDRALFKVFELVEGARLAGTAAPGELVSARVGWVTNTGRAGSFHVSTLAADDGSWSLRVPYATSGGPSALEIDSRYSLRSGRHRITVEVDEAAIRSGATIVAPAL